MDVGHTWAQGQWAFLRRAATRQNWSESGNILLRRTEEKRILHRMKKAVWLTFDLGIQGDYQSLYEWLDAQQAIECGDNVAFFNFEHDGTRDLADQIKESLKNTIQEDSKTRIYMIWRHSDKGVKGRFIFGQRKAPAWAGYAPKPATEEKA
jgi:bisphosphoglycerate-independent phosphoglycerate mutase (AlkP superfamily)